MKSFLVLWASLERGILPLPTFRDVRVTKSSLKRKQVSYEYLYQNTWVQPQRIFTYEICRSLIGINSNFIALHFYMVLLFFLFLDVGNGIANRISKSPGRDVLIFPIMRTYLRLILDMSFCPNASKSGIALILTQLCLFFSSVQFDNPWFVAWSVLQYLTFCHPLIFF